MELLKKVLFTGFIFLFFSHAYAGPFLTQSLSDEFKPEGIIIGEDLNKQVGTQVGPANIKGEITVSESWDSNIFLTPDSEKSDYINEVSPKIFMDMPFGLSGRHNFSLLYAAQLGSYLKNSSQNYQNQEVTGLLNFKLPFGYFAIRDFFNKTSDRAGTEFTNLIRRTENQADALFGVEFNKLADEIDYTHFTRRFNSRDYQAFNYTEDIGTNTLYYQLFPKTKALVEYNYGVINYTKDNTRDGDFYQVRAGLKGDLTGKTVGIVKAGYQDRKYKKDSGRKGFHNFVSEVGLQSQLNERTILRVRFSQSAVESIYDNNNYYYNNSLLMELRKGMARNLTLVGLMGVDRRLYPEIGIIVPKKRRDTVWLGSLGLEYQAKEWVKAALKYTYTQDISNIYEQCYQDNTVTASITFMR